MSLLCHFLQGTSVSFDKFLHCNTTHTDTTDVTSLTGARIVGSAVLQINEFTDVTNVKITQRMHRHRN